jgi:hypothetical protein
MNPPTEEALYVLRGAIHCGRKLLKCKLFSDFRIHQFMPFFSGKIHSGILLIYSTNVKEKCCTWRPSMVVLHVKGNTQKSRTRDEVSWGTPRKGQNSNQPEPGTLLSGSGPTFIAVGPLKTGGNNEFSVGTKNTIV